MPRGRWASAFVAFGAGLAGLGGGHALGYLVAAPASTERHETLAATGHTWLPHAMPVVVVFAFAGAALALAGPRLGRRGFGVSWRRLGALQALAFLAIEGAERLASGAHLVDGWQAIVAGVPLQLLAAALVALAVRLLSRAGLALVALARSRPLARPRAVARLRPRSVREHGRRARSGFGVRAPPGFRFA